MASEDEIRSLVNWYANAVTLAAQTIDADEDVGEVIRAEVDALSESEIRNVLLVMIGHHAQLAIKARKAK